MRITDSEGKELKAVYLALSEEEAAEVSGALADLRAAKPGWHAHIPDSTLDHRGHRLPRG